MAYKLRRQEMGRCIGVNIRASEYSGVGETRAVYFVSPSSWQRSFARLLPRSHSEAAGEADADTIQQVVSGCEDKADLSHNLNSPADVINRIQQCRLVITGSYHAAVFALSSGVAAVCLAKSGYYVDKFQGLADMFGEGCEVVLLDKPDMPNRLRAAVLKCWHSAAQSKPLLLQQAVRQINMGHQAYAKIRELVDARGISTLRSFALFRRKCAQGACA